MKMLFAVAVFVAAAALFGGIGRAAPPSRYPLDLDVAIGKAYGSSLSGIERSCTVWLNGGRDQYALAAVKLDSGHRDVGGFQFINTAGWFDMWRFHKPTAAVPIGARASVTKLVRQLATRCAARWTP
jgi:hypothetical protein